MSTRIKLWSFIALATLFVSWWFWPDISNQVLLIDSFIASNVFAVTFTALMLISVLGFVVRSLIIKSKRDRRAMQDMMRVAEQVRQQNAIKVAHIKKTSAHSEKTIAQSTKNIAPNLSVITGGKLLKHKPTPKHIPVRISADLFFQPIMDMKTQRIMGYDVFRQGTQSAHKAPIYVQHGRDASKSGRAKFEQDMFSAIAAITRHEMWSSLQQTGSAQIFVHVSEALIDDKTLWTEVTSMFKAHTGLTGMIVMIVDASKLLKGNYCVIKERLTKLERLADIGVSIGLSKFNADTTPIGNKKFRRFDFAVCDKNELLIAQIQAEEHRYFLANLERFSLAKTNLLVRDIVCEADVVDCLSEGANYLSGTFFAPPKKLKSSDEAMRHNSRSA